MWKLRGNVCNGYWWYGNKLTAVFASDRWTGTSWITSVSVSRNSDSPPTSATITLGVHKLIITLHTATQFTHQSHVTWFGYWACNKLSHVTWLSSELCCYHTPCTQTYNHPTYNHSSHTSHITCPPDLCLYLKGLLLRGWRETGEGEKGKGKEGERWREGFGPPKNFGVAQPYERADDTLWWTVQFSDRDGTRMEGGSYVAVLEESSTHSLLLWVIRSSPMVLTPNPLGWGCEATSVPCKMGLG